MTLNIDIVVYIPGLVHYGEGRGESSESPFKQLTSCRTPWPPHVLWDPYWSTHSCRPLTASSYWSSERDMRRRPAGWPLPRPKAVHHMIEDFLTEWDGPVSHGQPLRRFLEHCLQTDLRAFYAGNTPGTVYLRSPTDNNN